MSLSPQDVRDFSSAVRGLQDALTDMRGKGGNQATVTIQAGGIAVWLVTCACAFMVGMAMVAGMLMFTQQRQINDLQHYLQAIYMQAPSLRPQQGTEEDQDLKNSP